MPGDVSIVGFDDLRLARYTSPPLTTIRQPAGEIARHSTELLLGMIAGSKPAQAAPPLHARADRAQLDGATALSRASRGRLTATL